MVASVFSLADSLQCGRFLRERECFARESVMFKLEKSGENGASQKERGRGREDFFSPPPPLFPSFVLAPTLRVTTFTLPNLPPS